MSVTKEILSQFTPISLKEMDGVSLLSRVDTKFVFDYDTFVDILPDLMDDYFVLDVNDIRVNSYRSLYFDTDDFKFYYDHHNGKTNRKKVRFREYLDSGLCFLEIKQKNNKGVTKKSRVKVDNIEESLSTKSTDFITKILGSDIDLVPKHWNSYSRITFVNKNIKERLTIDTDFSFKSSDNKGQISKMIIAEVKQEKVNYASSFMRKIKEKGIRPFRISKYCMAMASLYPALKQNNFKPKFLKINQL
ncbi:MAG: polyphosphate polymerase domain-containing protein [Flavobacteriales bacterium]